MDSWLKALIAGACIVVIASGGYVVWQEFKRHQWAEEREQVRRADLAELVRVTNSGNETDLRAYCNSLRRSIERGYTSTKRERLLSACRRLDLAY